MDTSNLDLFSQKGALSTKDVTPWQSFSGKGMKFHLQSYDWNGCACLSYLTMRAFLGVMKMETLICTPYAKDLPLYSYDLISAFGKRILIEEVYDTQLNPVDLSAMQAVKDTYRDLKDKPLKPAWYDNLRLPPSTAKVGAASRLSALVSEMTSAYIDMFPTASNVDSAAKTARNRIYVEGLISNGGPAFDTISKMLGVEAAKTLFLRYIFGTE